MSEEQILTNPNSPGWRYLRDDETVQTGDEFLSTDCMWCLTDRVGEIAGPNVTYRRRIEQQQPKKPDDPGGPGWRWVCQGEKLELHDMMQVDGEWWPTKSAGKTCSKEGMYRRRIEQQQADYPSDSERYQMLKIETLSDMVQQLIADRDEYKRKAAISHQLAEMSRKQVVEMAEKIQYLVDRLAPTIQSREQE